MELHLLEPPRFRAMSIPRRGIPVRPGVLFARLTLAETEDYDALRHLRRTRAAAPWIPLAVYVPTRSLTVLSRLPAILSASGARAFVPAGEPNISMLRTALVDPDTWRSQLPAWAALVWPELPPNVWAMLAAVLEHDHPAMDNGRMTTRKVVNRRLAMAGIGPHRRLLAVLRFITALQYLWEGPDRTVTQAAISSPARYADLTSFSNQCLALCGHRPREMKSVLAWEWPLWAALRRGRP